MHQILAAGVDAATTRSTIGPSAFRFPSMALLAWLLASCASTEQLKHATPIAPEGPPATAAANTTAPPAASLTELIETPPASSSRSKPAGPRAPTAPRLPRTGGAYFQNDGPAAKEPAHLDRVPDAEPRVEALASWANRPYRVFGRQYQPQAAIKPFRQRGIASWYGRQFHGKKTAILERYDMHGMTAAHPTLPLPSYARVTNLETGRSVIVRVNDRGPFLNNRVIDLSYTAALRLGFVERGHTEVEVEQIVPAERQTPDAGQASARQPTTPLRTVSMAPPVVKGVTESNMNDLQATDQATPDDPPAAAIVAKPAGMTSATGLFLQMGAFRSRDNAIWVAAYLEEHFEVLVSQVQVFEQDGWYKVQVGPFDHRHETQQLRQQILLATDFTPFVTTRQTSP